MCHYCGCRDIPLFKEFISEHAQVHDLSGAALRALDAGDVAAARTLLERMADALRIHWAGEEEGLFRVMGAYEEYAAYIAALVREHRELDALLRETDLADPAGQRRVREAVGELALHISKEEDGLFPAALTALDGPEWDLALGAWERVHGRPVPGT